VTGADYGVIAGRDPRVQRAHGTLRWTGSWYEAQVAIDPFGGPESGGPELLAEIAAALEPFRRIGHDLRIGAAVEVPLDIALTICVVPHHLPGQVKAAVLEALRAFFDPDALTFGTPILLSRLTAVVQAVEGVQSVQVTRLQRLFAPPHGELASGVLPMGPGEIPRLDNTPGRPDRGRLVVTIGGAP
jgi:hypothetical protein